MKTIDIEWSEQDLAFRDEVRTFLATHLTDEMRAAGARMTSVYADHTLQMEWQRILHARGWAAPAWPVEYGGAGWSVVQRYIYTRERIVAGAPPVSPMGIQMCGPAIIGHGTPEQKAFFLPRMLSGEHVWCQGYSEPGAGSDLAALQMRAESDGDDLVCTGSKIWNTHADVSNWAFCLVRTTSSARRQKGITFLLIDMHSPGVIVKPIISLTGEHIQNEIFFDGVRVPKANVVGEIDRGWTVAKYLLEFERGGTAYAPELQVKLDIVAAEAARTPAGDGAMLADDSGFARRLAMVRMQVAALEMFEFRAMSDAARGGSPGSAASIMKLAGTELSQAVTELQVEVAGRYAGAYQPQAGCAGGPIRMYHTPGDHVAGPVEAALAPLRYLNQRAGSIYAGSNEIQRNILARHLGL